MIVAVAFGRFTGPTIEHDKLIRRVFKEKADKHLIYVFGPVARSMISDRDPLTVQEKVRRLRRLYPEYSSSFVEGGSRHLESPIQAIIKTWHDFQNDNLILIAGSHDPKDDGGSIEKYREYIEKYNYTRFADNSLRFAYQNIKYVEIQRGEVSGSKAREFARNHHINMVDQFLPMLSPRFKRYQAKALMKVIQKRMNPKKLEKPLVGSGYKAQRHTNKYINPFIGKQLTHLMAKDSGPFKKGDFVTILETRTDGSKHYTRVENHRGSAWVYNGHICKPAGHVKRNGEAGFRAEDELIKALKEEQMMLSDAKGAGSTGGHDFHLVKKQQAA